jgi:RNA polymerase sigma-70 factor (family 1)
MLTSEQFDKIFREYYKPMKLYAMRFVTNQDIAEDVVQDVFLNLWKIRDEFITNGSMKAYLLSAVYYRCLNQIKHKKIKISDDITVSEELNLLCAAESTAYRDPLFSEDILDQLKNTISELPDQCRRIYTLSRKFGLKNREIAEFLGVSLKEVEKQISKALSILRNRFLKH